jgi:hypothetical protein
MVGGASVVQWALVQIPSKAEQHHAYAFDGSAATRLAICRYDDDADFYLFRCDDLWQVLADTWHETLEEAMRQAEFEYDDTVGVWRAV